MKRKQIMALIQKKNERKEALVKQVDTCEDIATLRSMNTEIDNLNEDISTLNEVLAGMPNENDPDGVDENGQAFRTRVVNGEIPSIVVSNANSQQQRAVAANGENRNADKYSTPEYRKAFMEYCTRGTEIPEEFISEQRADTFTGTADIGAVIPSNIMNEIIKEMKVRGQIYSRVRKTNVPAGMRVPILSLKPKAKRITESKSSDRQKTEAKEYVSFSYYGLECKVAQSLLASIVALPVFEAEIVPLITEAMIEQIEYEAFNGSGEGEMLGILKDTRVKAAQNITLTAEEFASWESWKKKVFAKMPLAYRTGSFYMGAGTFDGYIDGMTDKNGQPIGRTNYGITSGSTYRFGGKEVIEVEEDVVKSYDTAAVGDVVAVFVDMKNYAVNSNKQMLMTRWYDNDNNQWVDKAILINDGKLLDTAGVLIIKKGAAAGE